MSISLRPPCDEGVLSSSRVDSGAPCPVRDGPWVLAATILGTSLVFIDGTVVNVALPSIQADLAATAADVQWVVESYALLLAALILVGGALGDRYGRRRAFSVGIALFAGASIACGLAANPAVLIAARTVQGVGGALLVPGSLAIISAAFDEERRGSAIGTWSAFTAISAAIGPLVGGWLVENASWRWAFFINVPIAIVVLAITSRFVPESRDPDAGPLDLAGATLATLGLGALVFGLIEAGADGLAHPKVVASIVVGSVALVAFAIVEARRDAPMLPPRLFASRAFSGANLLTFLLYASLGGALYFLPFNLIQVQGYTATEAGAALLPFLLIIFVLSRWAGGLVPRFGGRAPLIVGPILAAAGLYLLSRPGIGGSYWTTFFPGVVVLGLGMAVSVAPLTTVVMEAVDSSRAGIASGVNNAVSRAAGLLAIAVLGIVVAGTFGRELERRVDAIDMSEGARAEVMAQREMLGAASAPDALGAELTAAVETAIDEAYVSGYRWAMIVAAWLALGAAASAFVMLDGRVASASAPAERWPAA